MAELALVGMSGRAGKGKDHLGSVISARRGFFQLCFADHLKMTLIANGEMTWEEAFVEKPQRVRERMQQYGTEEIRDGVDFDFWINAIEGWIQTFHRRHKISKFVIADVRFANEVEWIHKNEGIVIRLDSDREGVELTEEQTAHRSESSLDAYEFPHRILNDEAEAEEAEVATLELVDLYLRSGAKDGKVF